MLNNYKKRFIKSNMILVGCVLLVTLTAVFWSFCHMNVSDLRATMFHLTEPFGSSRESELPGTFHLPNTQDAKEADSKPAAPDKPQEAPEPGREPVVRPVPKSDQVKHISVFFYEPDSGELSLLSKPLITDESALRTAAQRIEAAPESFGTLPEEGLYFYKKYTEKTLKIAVADLRFIRNSELKMLAVLLLVFCGAMAFFYMISRWMAKLATQPLEASLTMEKQFVADASHDLKTPLAVILANTSILRRGKASSDRDTMQWIESTQAAAQNMQALIEEMLTLSDMEAPQHKVDMKTINLSDIAEMAALLMEPVAYEKQIAYETDIAENIHIWANEEYMRRILQTLIENAAKYEGTGGSIRVTLSASHGKAIFQVTNQTALISKEDLPYIFERFYRTDKSRRASGHGLGLAIAKRMTELMNGKLEAASEEGRRTAFSAIFPLSSVVSG